MEGGSWRCRADPCRPTPASGPGNSRFPSSPSTIGCPHRIASLLPPTTALLSMPSLPSTSANISTSGPRRLSWPGILLAATWHALWWGLFCWTSCRSPTEFMSPILRAICVEFSHPPGFSHLMILFWIPRCWCFAWGSTSTISTNTRPPRLPAQSYSLSSSLGARRAINGSLWNGPKQ